MRTNSDKLSLRIAAMALSSAKIFPTILLQPKSTHSPFLSNVHGNTLKLSLTSLHKCRSVALKARAETRASETGAMYGLTGFIFGKMKATDMAHMVWRDIVRGGDFVIDATCGNGHDTLAMAKMVCEGSRKGFVYGMDFQKSALQNTSALLDSKLTPIEREQVKLFPSCHSKMEELVPEGISVRLVAFNLGYLPGGNKKIITTSKSTLLGLDAAARVLSSGGLISIMSYVGHPGGREEYEAVRSYASDLPATMWVSSVHEIVNRPSGPVLIFLFKR